MFEFKFAYRFKNGEVQGFKGSAFDKKIAEQKAYNKLYDKLEFLEERYDKKNIIHSSKCLSKKELDIIKNNWNEIYL